jgi:hypothetical protein
LKSFEGRLEPFPFPFFPLAPGTGDDAALASAEAQFAEASCPAFLLLLLLPFFFPFLQEAFHSFISALYTAMTPADSAFLLSAILMYGILSSFFSGATQFTGQPVRKWTPEKNAIRHTHARASSEHAWDPIASSNAKFRSKPSTAPMTASTILPILWLFHLQCCVTASVWWQTAWLEYYGCFTCSVAAQSMVSG